MTSAPPPPPLPSTSPDQLVAAALLRAVAASPDRRFDRRGEIGRGGAGTVDLLFDQLLVRPTAIKTLIESARSQPMMARAFLREAQVTAQLDHPNLVPIHDVGVDEQDRFYFTMKLVEGKTLAELIVGCHAEDPEPPAFERLIELHEVLLKVCDALGFAHSRGVIHCDLKAQNVMVGDFGEVYLMDWGFAQLLPPPADPERRKRWVTDPLPPLPESSTRGFVFGTLGTMSPEQARGLTEQLDERSDVFSLGALMYQFMTGQAPYVAETAAETVALAQACDFSPLVPTKEGTRGLRPKELVRIAHKAMARRPEDRYQSVTAFKADVLRFLRGGGQYPVWNIASDSLIIREGDEAHEVFIIASGECEVFTTVDGDRRTLQRLGPGEVFGEMALLTGQRRNASVITRGPTTLTVITAGVLDQELDSMKPWMGALVRSLASRFRAAQERHFARTDAQEAPFPLDDLDLWAKFK